MFAYFSLIFNKNNNYCYVRVSYGSDGCRGLFARLKGGTQQLGIRWNQIYLIAAEGEALILIPKCTFGKSDSQKPLASREGS